MAALFTLIWDALADVLGTAATATLLRRAAPRCAELTELVIAQKKLEYRYTLPSAWADGAEGTPLALRELVAELRPLLVELTGPVVVRRLERIPELRELPLTKEAAVRPEAGECSEPRALTGIRIVIVDDDRDMCDALQYLLESYGAEVTAATSAAEAFAALERSRPDVLLSDVAMPGESGYDLMRKIAAREGGDAPPAVALSSYAKETDRKQAIAAGFRTLVAKPIDPEALVAVVADLAAGRLTKNSGARP